MTTHRATPGTAVPPPPTTRLYEPGEPRTVAPPAGGLGAPAARAATPDSGRAARALSGPADPVRELMHRHRELCARAVDPLEIAAGLEAHGFTDRTAARFRHRDVFSLAEELFARVPRAEGNRAAPVPPGTPYAGHSRACGPHRRGFRALRGLLLPLLPGLLCALALALLELTQLRHQGAPTRIALGAGAALAVGAAVRTVLRRVARAVPTVPATLAACWLAGYALFGDELLSRLTGGVPPATGNGAAVPLSLTCAVAPAVWCARWFAVRARGGVADSRSLDEFAAGTRPLVATAVVLFTAALLGLQLTAAAVAGIAAPADNGPAAFHRDVLSANTALGMLLFTALLLTAHGFGGAAATGLGTACALEALALLAALAVRLPGADGAGRPVRAVVTALGPAVAPAVACGCAGLALLAYASRALTGAAAHHRESAP